jgi:hypothetical protein
MVWSLCSTVGAWTYGGAEEVGRSAARYRPTGLVVVATAPDHLDDLALEDPNSVSPSIFNAKIA